MRFLQNFFSIGSRRSKKKGTSINTDACGAPPVPDCQHEEQEVTVNRLLRSSSAHFSVVEEVDYTSLPPLRECYSATHEHFSLTFTNVAHPIHRVIYSPTVSTSSLASVSQRGTYTVKVLPRTIHSRTEFPNANPDESLTPKPQYGFLRHRSKSVPITPRDKTRLQGLRQDPSIASLLQMYDDHGCLDSKVFSNSPTSPEKEGRSQLRRGGSTLRQLLGGPSSLHVRDASAAESDISWAERCLWCGSYDFLFNIT